MEYKLPLLTVAVPAWIPLNFDSDLQMVEVEFDVNVVSCLLNVGPAESTHLFLLSSCDSLSIFTCVVQGSFLCPNIHACEWIQFTDQSVSRSTLVGGDQ